MNRIALLAALALLPSCDLIAVGSVLVVPCDGGVNGLCARIQGPICECHYCHGYAPGTSVAGYHLYQNSSSGGPCPGIGGSCTPVFDEQAPGSPPVLIREMPTTGNTRR